MGYDQSNEYRLGGIASLFLGSRDQKRNHLMGRTTDTACS